MNPLFQAVLGGGEGLDFLNSPLVLDYLRIKFSGTLPPWTTRNPFQPDVNEGVLLDCGILILHVWVNASAQKQLELADCCVCGYVLPSG